MPEPLEPSHEPAAAGPDPRTTSNVPRATNDEPRASTSHSFQSPLEGDEPRTTNHVENDDEISLLDLLIVLAKHKKLIFGLPFIAAILAGGSGTRLYP